MILTLRLLAILGLFALSTIPFAMAAEDDNGDDKTVVVEGDDSEGEED